MGSDADAVESRRARETPHGDLSWTKHGLDRDFRENDVLLWTIRELTSSRALGEESRAMHHCVASDAHRCAHGKTAIFSICADAIRKGTVELEPFSRRVVQVRGLCNRAATPHEHGRLAGPGAGRASAW